MRALGLVLPCDLPVSRLRGQEAGGGGLPNSGFWRALPAPLPLLPHSCTRDTIFEETQQGDRRTHTSSAGTGDRPQTGVASQGQHPLLQGCFCKAF